LVWLWIIFNTSDRKKIKKSKSIKNVKNVDEQNNGYDGKEEMKL
jgi:hypothetical protein